MVGLVSIIVPVYNAGQFLRRCLDSLKKQRYDNIEVLMVNDGSTDSSAAICAEYAQKDPRFVLLNRKNGGPSKARNAGLYASHGQYIMFADSDDWLAPSAVSRMVARIQHDGTDLVVCSFNRIINDVAIPMGAISRNAVLSRDSYVLAMEESPADFYYGVMWNKLYLASIIRAHKIYCSPQYRWCEDFLFNMNYLKYVQSISTLNAHLYFYVKRDDSICGGQVGLTQAVRTKYQLLKHYKKLFDGMELSRLKKLKVNGFLFAYAHDTGESEYRKIATVQRHQMRTIQKGQKKERRTRQRKARKDQ